MRSMMGSVALEAFEVFSEMYCGVAELPTHVYEEETSCKGRRVLYEWIQADMFKPCRC